MLIAILLDVKGDLTCFAFCILKSAVEIESMNLVLCLLW